MTDTQTLEILDVLKSLPSEKVGEVKDFAVFLRERYGKAETIKGDLRDNNSSQAKNQKTPAEILAEIAALPIEGKTDKFSGRDHDKILYGEDRKK